MNQTAIITIIPPVTPSSDTGNLKPSQELSINDVDPTLGIPTPILAVSSPSATVSGVEVSHIGSHAAAKSVFDADADKEKEQWAMFRQEAAASDQSLLEGWQRSMDFLLIFVSVFSFLQFTYIQDLISMIPFRLGRNIHRYPDRFPDRIVQKHETRL